MQSSRFREPGRPASGTDYTPRIVVLAINANGSIEKVTLPIGSRLLCLCLEMNFFQKGLSDAFQSQQEGNDTRT
jgi:hypothetical protein